MLYFAGVTTLLVDQTSLIQTTLDFPDDRPPIPDITESQMLLILVNIIKMGHDICDNMKDYWPTANFTFLWQNSET
jgi:hypothetical protein